MYYLIIHGTVYPVTTPRAPRRGGELGSQSIVADGAIVIKDGLIQALGPTEDILQAYRSPDQIFDAQGRIVIPGFVDCHTHLPFAGWRADEYRSRLLGQSYQNLGRGEGGIARSSRQLNIQSDEQVLTFTESLTREMLSTGTTAFEMKSGYGLSVQGELRQLALIQRLKSRLDQRITATGLFLHALPQEYTADNWVDVVIDELLPAAHERQLVDAVDVFIESTAFTPEQAQRFLHAAQRLNLILRVHSDQFSHMGGTALALALGARGIDHLDHLTSEDVAAFGDSRSVAVLLPAATYSMNHQPFPPARDLIEHNAAIAIASDFNPGTAPISHMPLIISLAVHLFGLTPEEALSATTINPAYVLGIEQEVGSIEVGKRADLLILDTDQLESIPYRAGHNPIYQGFVKGKQIR
ncbi:imidazolonepropionase [Sulfobacillus thermosulfidooxidans]|uniref:imidazolonepropionase n=1 Tax=Sulfobacillus thermosulfidooxidans TaxID=28034 RepID=UPI0006B4E03D|nr:imidazolonepropionase [Sulfobacillus thermosulfidooxidans]